MKEDEHNISSIVDTTCSWKNPLAFGTVAAFQSSLLIINVECLTDKQRD